ncbi:MAG: gluconokinase [Spirosomataceae bacterium]
MDPYFIGLDLGTSSTKVVAFDQRGNTLLSSGVSYPTFYPGAHQSVQKPETIWQAVKSAVRRVLETVGRSYELAGVGMSSAMHTLLPIDNKGRPLTDMMIWSDNRADHIVSQYLQHNGDTFYQQSGVPLHPMTPFAKLLWAKQHQPTWWREADLFVGIKEWIWYKLTGVFETDYSVGGATGMFNLATHQWSCDALKAIDLDIKRLPAMVDTLTVRECVTDELFPKGTPLVIGASDGCLATLGSGAVYPDTMAVTVGTSAAARALRETPLTDPSGRTFCYYVAPQKYVLGGGSNNGGIVAEWFVKNFADNNFGTFYEWLQNAHPGADGLLFIPYLQGERAPVWNAGATGVFHGMTMHHTRTHFARAVMEGILLNVRYIAESVTALGNQPIEQVKVGGGLATSPVVMQLLSDVLGAHVHITQTNEHSAWGATMLAMWALGFADSFEHLPEHPPMVIFAPQQTSTDFYATQLGRFKQLYEQTKVL